MWITHSGVLSRDKKTAGNESLGAKKDQSSANGGYRHWASHDKKYLIGSLFCLVLLNDWLFRCNIWWSGAFNDDPRTCLVIPAMKRLKPIMLPMDNCKCSFMAKWGSLHLGESIYIYMSIFHLFKLYYYWLFSRQSGVSVDVISGKRRLWRLGHFGRDAEGLGGISTHLSKVCDGQHTWLYLVVLGAIFVMFVVFLTHLSKVAWFSGDIVLVGLLVIYETLGCILTHLSKFGGGERAW